MKVGDGIKIQEQFYPAFKCLIRACPSTLFARYGYLISTIFSFGNYKIICKVPFNILLNKQGEWHK